MEVAIIDDEQRMLDIICGYVLNNKERIKCKCDTFQKGIYVLNKMKNGHKYDLYLLDIDMPEINGLDLAREIRNIHSDAYIVFVTSYVKYVLESYDLGIKAYYYIMKEHMQEKLSEVIVNISHELENQKGNYYIIQNKQRYERLKLAKIIYIYKEEKNSVFITDEGTYKERKALKNVIKCLNDEFLLMDSGRIINIMYIQRIEKNCIVLINGTELYTSDANIRRLKKNMRDYWRGYL